MNPSDFIHPDDASTMRQLENIPAFPTIINKMMELGIEQIQWTENMTSFLRLSEKQKPEIYRLLPPICQKMGIMEPELYLDPEKYMNAYTSGNTKVCIVISQKLVDELTEEELTAVLAHECGHILCRHTLYTSVAEFLFTMTDSFINESGLLGNLSELVLSPLKSAILAWQRNSELSADRAATIISSPEVLVRVMALLQGFPRKTLESMNLASWIAQAKELEIANNNSTWHKVIQKVGNSELTHPHNVIRAYEIMKWATTEQYSKIIKHMELLTSPDSCPSCGRPIMKDWGFCKSCGYKLQTTK